MNEEEKNLQLLIEKLMAYTMREDEAREVINNVNEIVIVRALREYIASSQDPIVKILQTLPETEALEYFQKNAEAMPRLNEDRLKEIGIQTWSEYFQFMDSQ